MTTITEDYVSFEMAKLLKEKGFGGVSTIMYKENGEMCINPKSVVSWRLKYWYPCLTLQMAMKWLRKKHNILLFILPAQENGKLVYLVEVWTWNEEEGIYESTYAPMPRKEPEEALEVAVKYCLENLVK